MLHEACDIVEDAGGWTCRTCRAHWRVSFQPDTCADGRIGEGAAERADAAARFVVAVVVLLGFAVARVVGVAPFAA